MPAPIRPSMPGSGTAVPPVDEEVVVPPEVVEDEVVVPPEVDDVVVPPEVDEVVEDEVVVPPEVDEVDDELVLPHIDAPAEWPQLQ